MAEHAHPSPWGPLDHAALRRFTGDYIPPRRSPRHSTSTITVATLAPASSFPVAAASPSGTVEADPAASTVEHPTAIQSPDPIAADASRWGVSAEAVTAAFADSFQPRSARSHAALGGLA